MVRSLSDVDRDLAKAVARRVEGRCRISTLSQCIVADTRLVDELLAERAVLMLARYQQEAPSGR